MEREKLLRAVDNEENKSMLKYTTKKIEEDIKIIIEQLPIGKEVIKTIKTKLKNYQYVQELDQFKLGSYIRWINLYNMNEIKLTIGGIIIEHIMRDDGYHIMCKTMKNSIIELNPENCLIFKKLNQQELVILTVLDYLDK